jgi:hypothetical protein
VLKSVLGFVKVALVLDQDVLREKIPPIVATILSWSDVCAF